MNRHCSARSTHFASGTNSETATANSSLFIFLFLADVGTDSDRLVSSFDHLSFIRAKRYERRNRRTKRRERTNEGTNERTRGKNQTNRNKLTNLVCRLHSPSGTSNKQKERTNHGEHDEIDESCKGRSKGRSKWHQRRPLSGGKFGVNFGVNR